MLYYIEVWPKEKVAAIQQIKFGKIVSYSSKQKSNWIKMLYYIEVLLYSCLNKFFDNISWYMHISV